MKKLAKPRGWEKFQHYKDRLPPWIKLHKVLLDDRDFQRLPVASRALAPMLWLLASESEDGSFDVSIEELVFRLRQPQSEIVDGLKPLFDAGFFSLEQPDSDVLAGCKQLAPQRREEAEAEAEGEKPQAAPAPAPPGKAKRQKLPELQLSAWIEQEKQADRKLFGDYKPLWDYASANKIPRDWIEVAWIEFRKRYVENANSNSKKYADWRQTFLNHVRNGYEPKLWSFNRTTHEPFLTDVGIAALRELEAQEVAA